MFPRSPGFVPVALAAPSPRPPRSSPARVERVRPRSPPARRVYHTRHARRLRGANEPWRWTNAARSTSSPSARSRPPTASARSGPTRTGRGPAGPRRRSSARAARRRRSWRSARGLRSVARASASRRCLAPCGRCAGGRGWARVIVAAAFVAGVAIDRIGDAQRINVLAPPVLALLVWNLAVYGLLAIGFVVHYGDAVAAGPLRRAVAAIRRRAAEAPRPTPGRRARRGDRAVRRRLGPRFRAAPRRPRDAHPPPGRRGAGRGTARRSLPARHRVRVSGELGKHVPRRRERAPAARDRVRAGRGAHRRSGPLRRRRRGDPRTGRRERRALAAPDGGDGRRDRDRPAPAARAVRVAGRAVSINASRARARRALLPATAAGLQRRAGPRAHRPLQLRAAAGGDRGDRATRRARVRRRRRDHHRRARELRRRGRARGGGTAGQPPAP